MRRIVLLGLLLTVAAPGSAAAAGCSPLSCAPVATGLPGTDLLAVQATGVTSAVSVVDLRNGATTQRLPNGILAGATLLHKEGAAVSWIDVTTGSTTATRTLPSYTRWRLTGASMDGSRAVLIRAKKRPLTTTFAIVGSGRSQVTLAGNWEFDALSGQRLYLLQYYRLGYKVRLYDLARHVLVQKPVKNGDEGALITGIPWSRLASGDGRYVFTLYIGSSGDAMIHELDLRAGTARCIDLPGRNDFNAAAGYGLALSPDGKTVWAASVAYGRVAAVDVASAKVRLHFGFASRVAQNGPAAPAIALNPQGDRLALLVKGRTYFVDLHARTMTHGPSRTAQAIGFSPDGKTLWAIGARASATALAVPR